MKQITPTFAYGRIEEFPELQEAHRKVKAEYESLHQRMKSLDRRQIDSLPDGEYTVERKWDGVFVGHVVTSNSSTFLTPSGNVYRIDCLPQEDYPLFTIGELCSKRGDARRERVHGVLSALATGDVDGLMFHPFDGCAPSIPKSRIGEVFDQYLATGAEGIVIRQVNGSGIWKLKPKMNIDCVVIGYTEETVGEVKSLIVGLVRPDGCIQPLGAVGSNIKDHERKSIWMKLHDYRVDCDDMVHDGQRVMTVKPFLCIEISCNDIVTKKSDGSNIIKPCYNRSVCFEALAPFCTLRGAYFERVREDKSIVEGVDTSQVIDYVHIDGIDTNCWMIKKPESQVIEESRFVKGDAVKRLLAVQRGDDPEYVVHLTDYSPNRAEPTKYEIEVTGDAGQEEELFESKCRAIEAVRGWSRA